MNNSMTAPVAGGVLAVLDRGIAFEKDCQYRTDLIEARATIEAMADALGWLLQTADFISANVPGAGWRVAQHHARQVLAAYRGEAAAPAKGEKEVRLFDSQWVNIVNHANCWRDYEPEAAVHEAVRMTEAAIAKNVADGVLPDARSTKPATPAGGGDLSEFKLRRLKDGGWIVRIGEASIPELFPTPHDALNAALENCRLASTGSAPAPSGDARDAARYRWLKSNGIIRVLPIASGMMSRGGTRILANTKDWLPGDFTYVIDGKTQDVDTAIDYAMSAAPTPEPRHAD